MSVKIYGGHYLGGMPTLEYKIEINGVVISLKSEDFAELATALGEKIADDYQKAVEAKAKYDNNVDKVQRLRRDIIKVFWDNEDEESAFYFRRDPKDIDQDKLIEVLEKYNRFLGFE